MRKFEYNTGRVYDFEQVLECEIVEERPFTRLPSKSRGELEGKTLVINVKDLSRNIYFTVEVITMFERSDSNLGQIVLEKYDSCDTQWWSPDWNESSADKEKRMKLKDEFQQRVEKKLGREIW